MTTPPRITRPLLPRTEPIRAFSGGSPAASERAESSSTSIGDTIADAVDLGYRVLDEYIRQGQAAASRFGVPPDRVAAAGDDLQALATRLARYTSDVMGVWSQFLELAVSRGGFAPATGAGPRAEPLAPPAPAANRTDIAVRVTSRQPVELTVDVASPLLGRALTVQPLRASDPAVAPITGARIEAAAPGRGARLDVVIPPEQPPGAYVGVVVDDETGRFAGTVHVTVVGVEE